MHHRVGVLNADAVRAKVGLHDVHHRIVCIFLRPIALPFEHHHERRDGLGAGLNHALHRVIVRELAHVAAAVFDDIDFVAVVNRLNRRQRDAGLRPSPARTIFFLPLFSIAATKFLSSQEFIDERSMGV